jgi:phytoene synthase
MASQTLETLPLEAQLAVAHTRPNMRGALRIFLELDQRLGRIVAATNEPMLGQMRLAWWRDELGKPVAERPVGDAVLDGIGKYWAGKESRLIKLVDGWEHLLADPPLSEEDALYFATTRRDAMMAVYGKFADNDDRCPAYSQAAWFWALSDFAANISAGEERDLVLRLGLRYGDTNQVLPGEARGLAVLGALGLRALKRGGRPLMEGRTASLVATRAAIFGK